jgi:hypothetical protein
MYILPLPEVNAGNIGYDGLLDIVQKIPDEDWRFQPPRNPNEQNKSSWHRVFANHPIYELYVNQFAIPRESFDSGTIKIRLYQLLPHSSLHNHKDRQHNVILFVNIHNFNDTEFYFYPNAEKDAVPMITMTPPRVPYLVDGLEYHGVKNLSDFPRIALAVQFSNPYTFDKLEQMYKDRTLLKCQQCPDYRFVGGREFWNDGPLLDVKAV